MCRKYELVVFAFAYFALLCCSVVGRQRRVQHPPPPNIVFILADDLGFNNVGWQQKKHGMEPEIHTPVIDELAENGLHLDRMYSYKYCSPSRSSFLSGRLPIHVTQNNKNNLVTNPGGADLRMKLLPQALKERFNYKTHMVSKSQSWMDIIYTLRSLYLV